MTTIPASQIVNVLPGVLSAGGNSLVLNGLVLTTNSRVPAGTVVSFPAATAVSSYFGALANETLGAAVYFQSYDNSTQKPGALLFAQYNPQAVPAYLRSSNVTTLGLSAIQALSGSLTVVIDGYSHVAAAINLAGATSYSSAAALIQTGLTATPVTAAVVTAAIATASSTITGSINDYILTVTGVTGSAIAAGSILTGGTVLAGTAITSQFTGTPGGVGTYALSASAAQVVVSGTLTGTYGLMTVSAVTSGTLSVGQILSGSGVSAGTRLSGLGTGTGLTGTYYVTPSQTVASTSVTASAAAPTVTFDSVANAFVVQSGISGAASTIAFATGTLAVPLLMTSATGAVLSQGVEAASPSAFMTNVVVGITQNWATFLLAFDPDFGTGNMQKLIFAQWTNGQNSRYIYLATDTDASPTTSIAATNSLGYLVGPNGSNYTGICPIYDPNNNYIAWLMAGYVASLDFNAANARTTAAFRTQTGLTAPVTNQTVASNLIANGYNFYGAYATANQQFIFFYPGSISGPFLWLDSFANQIWLNSQLQLALMTLLATIPSIPYNAAGYAMIESAALTPIQSALNFGAFRSGVTLSQTQIAAVNNAAAKQISPILAIQGYYFQVQPASPQVRAARQSPPCFFWYTDGQSVQKITLNSIDVL